MAKRAALKDHVSLDSVDLSNFCRAVSFASEHERLDVSGFNPTGASEFLAGQTTQSVTLEVYGSYGSGEVHQTVYPVHRDRDIVPFEWRHDQTASVSVTNPQLEGNVQILTYSPGATRGEVETYTIELTAADASGLAFHTT